LQISTVLGVAIPAQRAKNEWVEGVAIWVAVIVVTLVGAGNDWSKDRQFRKLNAQKDQIMVKALRDGKQTLIENVDIVVGDVLILDTGDKVVADGVLINTQVMVMAMAATKL
jgi:Ca2+-transporting ATPase